MNLQQTVYESLNNARENGYDLTTWDSEEIAEDLMQYDTGCENSTVEELVPHINKWKESNL